MENKKGVCTFMCEGIEKPKVRRGQKIADRFQEEFDAFADSCVDENYFIKMNGFQLKKGTRKNGEKFRHIKMIAVYPAFGIEISKYYIY